jgi:ATP-binding cassette subfamily B protein
VRRAFRAAAAVGLPLLVAATALTLAGSAAPAVAAWSFRSLIDSLQQAGRWQEAVPVAVLVSVTGTLTVLTPATSELLVRRLAGLMKVQEHDDLFRSVNRHEDMSRFDDPGFHSDLTLARERGIEASGDVVAVGLRLLHSVAMSLGFATALFAVYPLLIAGVAVAAVPVVAIELSLGQVRLAAVRELNAYSRERFLYSQAMAGHREAKEVRLLAIGDFLRGRARSRFRSAVDAEHRLARRELAMNVASILIGLGLSLATMLWGIAGYRRGDLSLGDLTVVATAGAGIIQGLSGSVAQVGQLRHSLDVQRVLVDVVDVEPGNDQEPEVVDEVPPLRSAIELKGVGFRYAGHGGWAVHDVDLRIGAGQMVAVVGANGAGKTTLAKLVCRLYEPSSGAVLWDGVDVRAYTHTGLRRRIGVLFQDFVIYEFSAAENIGIGDIERIDARAAIEAAAAVAGADATIEQLPRGYATRLTRMYPDPEDDTASGVVLSGGQEQRVTIARVLMRSGADLLVLDEPTSGLDPDAEAELLATLREQRAGKATVFITHRLGAARTADLIVVVAGGTVVEQGDHDQLMAAGGAYARLYRLQAAGYEGSP